MGVEREPIRSLAPYDLAPMELPPPPECSFASDNAAGVSPEVMEALVAANTPSALAYGDDPWTAHAEARFRELYDAPVEVLWCWGGTGANVVGLACLLQPWQAVLCPASAHIVVDECGAPARFTGATICPVPDDDGKLTIDAMSSYLAWSGSEHHPQPGVISISQSTESGTLYTVDEIAELADWAHGHGLRVHLDGARIANAVAATGADLTTMIRDTGVDVMTFGATKNGAMYGEVVVFLQPDSARNARFVRKQAGQLPSKARFVAAQLNALLDDGLWLRNAEHANRQARRLAAAVGTIPGVEVVREPQVNAVFARLPIEAIEPLQRWSFFWEWDLADRLVRWMTSFVTTDHDIERFVSGVRAVVAPEGP